MAFSVSSCARAGGMAAASAQHAARMRRFFFKTKSSAVVSILFRGRIVGVKLNNRRSRSLPGYMRLLEWKSTRRAIRRIQLCQAAIAVAKPGLALDTCGKMNMLFGMSGRQGALTKGRYAGDD